MVELYDTLPRDGFRAFVAGFEANPSDCSAYSVFADFLQENDFCPKHQYAWRWMGARWHFPFHRTYTTCHHGAKSRQRRVPQMYSWMWVREHGAREAFGEVGGRLHPSVLSAWLMPWRADGRILYPSFLHAVSDLALWLDNTRIATSLELPK